MFKNYIQDQLLSPGHICNCRASLPLFESEVPWVLPKFNLGGCAVRGCKADESPYKATHLNSKICCSHKGRTYCKFLMNLRDQSLTLIQDISLANTVYCIRACICETLLFQTSSKMFQEYLNHSLNGKSTCFENLGCMMLTICL